MRDDDAVYLSPADGFELLADTYDSRQSGDPTILLETTATLAALPPLTGARVVDLGCGTGRYALQLARLGAAQVVGLDLSVEMLARTEHKARRAERTLDLVQGDLRESLPLPEGAFDAAVCALTVSFLPELEAPLARMARLLRPGGVLVLSELHPWGLAAERAASAARLRNDRAPYLRFTSAAGQECRIPRAVHGIGALFNAARAAGLTLERLDEPAADSRLAASFPSVRDRIGMPLSLTLTLRKP